MTYHFAEDEIRRRNEQRSRPSTRAASDRRGDDRRQQADPAFAGPERRTRKYDRRASVEQQPSRWPWLLVAASALMVYDALFHDAEYRKHLVYELNDIAGATRIWSANLWKQG